MNANELADELNFIASDYDAGTVRLHKEIATMLRQQQLKIDNLLENNARLDAEIEVLKSHPANACKHGVDDGACKECYLEATHPAELTDEEISDFLYVYCLDMGDVYEASEAKLIECVRAILRKAR